MENYKRVLARRTQLYGGLCGLVPLCLLAVNWLAGNARSSLGEHDMGFIHGLSAGFALLSIALAVFTLVRNQMALKDGALLKRMYIQETDERRLFIQNKVGGTGMRLAVFFLVFAAVIACYFNMTVTYTLIAAALGLSLLMLGFKLYYRSKY